MRKHYIFLCILIFQALTGPASAKGEKINKIQSVKADKKAPVAQPKTRPLSFTENNGQYADVNNHHVLYRLESNSFHLDLYQRGFSYQFVKKEPGENYGEDDLRQVTSADQGNDHISVKTMRVEFDNAASTASLMATDSFPFVCHYYQGRENLSDGITAHCFKTVLYQNIYRGIDFRISATDSGAEYSFVIHAGADPGTIQMKNYGVLSMKIDENGNLLKHNELGFVQESAPKAFQQGKSLPVSFVLKDGNAAFLIKQWDHQQDLIIDPNVIWGTYFGAAANDQSDEIAVDALGNVVVAGITTSTSGITTGGVFQSSFGGGAQDMILTRFDSKGNLLWCTYFGGDSSETAYGLATDAAGNIFLTGATTGSAGLATAGAVKDTFTPGAQDALIVKFNSNGQRMWSTYIGGNGDDEIRSAVCDKNGNLWVAGYTTSTNSISTAGSFQSALAGPGGDAFIMKLSKSGQLKYGSYFGASSVDRAHSVNLDESGNILVAGTTQSSSGMSTPGAHQESNGGILDLWIGKFDSAGFRIWSTYFGGEETDRGRGIVADESGNIYITGYTYSENSIATPEAFQTVWTPGYGIHGEKLADALLAKFTKSGQLVWSTYYGGDFDDLGRAVEADAEGNVFIFGNTGSDSMMTSPDGYQPVPSAYFPNNFLAKFSSSGNRIWGTYLNGAADASGEDMDYSMDGFLYLTGNSSNNGFLITPNAFQTQIAGLQDAYVLKFYPGDDCFDAFENNNSFNTAYSITAGNDSGVLPVSAKIISSTDKDFFKFSNNPESRNMRITLKELPANYNLYLYNIQKQLLEKSTNGGTSEETIIFNTSVVGAYYVKVIGKNNAHDLQECYQLHLLLDSNTFFMRDAFNAFSQPGELPQAILFPNPSGNLLTLSINSPLKEIYTITVFNLIGEKMQEESLELHEGNNNFSIQVNEWRNGVYIISFQSIDLMRGNRLKFVKE